MRSPPLPLPRPKSSLDVVPDGDHFWSEQRYAQAMRQSFLQQTPEFARSASARLPRPLEGEAEPAQEPIKVAELQREESMRRLLEWKQRMLQSPLTRKPPTADQPAVARGRSGGSDGSRSGRCSTRSRSQDGRRSASTMLRHNSYSSDDEEPGDPRKSRKRLRRPSQQAGRSHRGAVVHLTPNYENVRGGGVVLRPHDKHSDSGYDTLLQQPLELASPVYRPHEAYVSSLRGQGPSRGQFETPEQSPDQQQTWHSLYGRKLDIEGSSGERPRCGRLQDLRQSGDEWKRRGALHLKGAQPHTPESLTGPRRSSKSGSPDVWCDDPAAVPHQGSGLQHSSSEYYTPPNVASNSQLGGSQTKYRTSPLPSWAGVDNLKMSSDYQKRFQNVARPRAPRPATVYHKEAGELSGMLCECQEVCDSLPELSPSISTVPSAKGTDLTCAGEPSVSHKIQPSPLLGREEGEDDKEVAAVLGSCEHFESRCRDLGSGRPRDDELEVIVTPGYLRLSLGDSDQQYMPMTPSKRAVLAPEKSPSASLLENLFEESSYVEMTEVGGLGQSVLAPNYKPEPVYMELCSTEPASTLPDILNSSATPANCTPTDCESSDDADDEASKDLDSLEVPRQRLSLSDTFRPASYYLGASRERVPETADSSDSDLVSPPPIPSSSPPLDDDVSAEEEEKGTVELEMEERASCSSVACSVSNPGTSVQNDTAVGDIHADDPERDRSEEAYYENVQPLSTDPSGYCETLTRSRSLEGLADDLVEDATPWEHDALWQDSLRRVSLRHARSLDALDSPLPTAPTCHLRRHVTYVNEPSFEIDRETLRQWDLMSSAPLRRQACHRNLASGSGSVMGRETLPPRALSALSLQPPNDPPEEGAGKRESLSAGELLGRTHEELVLLLIQLRRHSSGLTQNMQLCRADVEAQARLAELETPHRLEHLHRLEQLRKHLLELEKQYEKGRPLVNLVDNMVKLGSLYRGGRERVQLNQLLQERRLLAEERRDWARLSADRGQLQAKVQQLYRLDRLLQHESGTLHGLQQDKELLERALGGLRNKLSANHAPAEAERYRQQQRLLQRELSRVRTLLAHSSAKLEETVAENARLEAELVGLRHKLQASRRLPRPAPTEGSAGAGALEAELRRVQRLVGDLQRQRRELSQQVRQLTQRSHSLAAHMRPAPSEATRAAPMPGRKRQLTSWLETDLDSLQTVDCGHDVPDALYMNSPAESGVDEDIPAPAVEDTCSSQLDISEADDRMKRFYGIIPREKQQEIKTVRIVKRESERRQRDRDRTGHIGVPLTNGTGTGGRRVSVGEGGPEVVAPALGRVVEDPLAELQFQRSLSLPRGFGKRERLSAAPAPPLRMHDVTFSAHQQLFGSPTPSPQLSPVFKSEAARAIVMEMSGACEEPPRRAVPREKRRHHTVSSAGTGQQDSSLSLVGSARSRDDLDMECALRPRLNAPDVVRSTLSHRDLKYNEQTIDSVLGTPRKIVIPERYIPEQAPEMSAEEQLRRLKKAEAIRKMLSGTSASTCEHAAPDEQPTATLRKKVAAEKRQREHLLQLNQILARQVMERSKAVAVKALASLPLTTDPSFDEDDLSPVQPLPLYQQRENYFS